MKKILFVLGLAVIFASTSYALSVGMEGAAPYLRFAQGSDQSIDVSLNSITYTNADAYALSGFVRLNRKIARVGAITSGWGLQLNATYTKAATTTTTLGGTLLVSAEYLVTDGVAIYGNLNLLTVAGATGAGTLLTGNANAYSGIRVNI